MIASDTAGGRSETPATSENPEQALSQPPVWLPVGQSLRSVARRRVWIDGVFWLVVVLYALFALCLLGMLRVSPWALLTGSVSMPGVAAIGSLVLYALVVLWVFNYRAQVIADRIQRSMPITVCRACLYDTAGLDVSRCPECGALIANAMRRTEP